MSDVMEVAEKLRQEYADQLPPVHQWDPPLSGDIDMRIARDGRWFHEGEEITRFPLVKLFSTILKREGDDYFLVTPVEKWRIQVEDAPFYIVKCEAQRGENSGQQKSEQQKGDQQVISMSTYTEDRFVVDADHPVWVEERQADNNRTEPAPYVMVRDNMPGLIGRNVYYELIDIALAQVDDPDDDVRIKSAGESFSLSP